MNQSLLGYPPATPASAAAWTTGDVKVTLKTSADSGWVMMNDGSIGNIGSGATTRANVDTRDLYILLWNNIADTWAPVSGGRGPSALADFVANKTLTLPKSLGRALSIAGAGASLTSRALGEVLGAETHTLTQAQLPAVGLSVSASGSASGGSMDVIKANESGFTGVGMNAAQTSADGTNSARINQTITAFSASVSVSGSTSALGSGQSHNIMQPASFFNVMVKL